MVAHSDGDVPSTTKHREPLFIGVWEMSPEVSFYQKGAAAMRRLAWNAQSTPEDVLTTKGDQNDRLNYRFPDRLGRTRRALRHLSLHDREGMTMRPCVSDWMKLNCGDRVHRLDDPKHVGRLIFIWNSAFVTIRWEETGWLEHDIPMGDVKRIPKGEW